MKKIASVLTALMIGTGGVFAGSVIHRLQVTNSSNKKVSRLLVAADGQGFAAADIGSGIRPSETLDLNLNTENGTQCNWRLKAVYADRSESTSQQFNVCEKDAVVELK